MSDTENPIVKGEIDEVADVNGETAAPENETVNAEAETEETSTDKSEPTDKPKKGGLQKRIDELTRQRYEEAEARKQAEERVRLYEEQMQKLQTQSIQTEWQQQQPRIENYDSHEDWARAYSSWMEQGYQKQRDAEKQAQMAQAKYQAEAQKQMNIQRKVAEAQVKYPDFALKVNDPNLPSLSSMNAAAYEALMESDNMAEVAYYLASNPSSVYAFREMTPIQAVKEIARLESKLASKPGVKVTNASAPPSKVTGKTEAVTDPDKLPVDEWVRWRTQQLRK